MRVSVGIEICVWRRAQLRRIPVISFITIKLPYSASRFGGSDWGCGRKGPRRCGEVVVIIFMARCRARRGIGRKQERRRRRTHVFTRRLSSSRASIIYKILTRRQVLTQDPNARRAFGSIKFLLFSIRNCNRGRQKSSSVLFRFRAFSGWSGGGSVVWVGVSVWRRACRGRRAAHTREGLLSVL